jgi:hypothetical protein
VRAVACVKKYRPRHLDRAATGSRTANRGRGIHRGRGVHIVQVALVGGLLLAFRNRPGERAARRRVAARKFLLIASEKKKLARSLARSRPPMSPFDSIRLDSKPERATYFDRRDCIPASDDSPGHVNVLIHWGVCGNSTFRLHARRRVVLSRRTLRRRERHTLNPMLHARPNVLLRAHLPRTAHRDSATRLGICFRFVFGSPPKLPECSLRPCRGATAFDHALGFTLKYPCPNECPRTARECITTAVNDCENHARLFKRPLSLRASMRYRCVDEFPTTTENWGRGVFLRRIACWTAIFVLVAIVAR